MGGQAERCGGEPPLPRRCALHLMGHAAAERRGIVEGWMRQEAAWLAWYEAQPAAVRAARRDDAAYLRWLADPSPANDPGLTPPHLFARRRG
ncbi:MAG TPA: hypothetical protein VED40_02830 [Azospirillaceae bacterium]|nr:hypothetical protein [Azospirillaceae bacterium]